MIGFIKGEAIEVGDGKILVISGNIGFNVMVLPAVGEYMARHGKEIELYTYMSVREDAIQLYGFLTKGELDIYKLLTGVNGIGPKAAMSVLSNMSPDELCYAIASGDYKQIMKAPGLGAKTAQKIILDLKDKINSVGLFSGKVGTGGNLLPAAGTDASKDAIMALVALGYPQTEAMRAVAGAVADMPEEMTCEAIIKEALKLMI